MQGIEYSIDPHDVAGAQSRKMIGVIPAMTQEGTSNRRIERINTRDERKQRVSIQDGMCDRNGLDRNGGFLFHKRTSCK